MLKKRIKEENNKPVEPIKKVVASLVGMAASPLVGFGPVCDNFTIHNLSPSFYASDKSFLIANNKLRFAVNDIYLGVLNSLVNNGIINPAVVNINTFLPSNVCYGVDEKSIIPESYAILQDLYNKVYAYAAFSTGETEKGSDIIETINNSVAAFHNLLLFHLSTYYNERCVIDTIGGYGFDATLGAVEEAYKYSIGHVFCDEDNLNKTNEVLAYYTDRGHEVPTREFEVDERRFKDKF